MLLVEREMLLTEFIKKLKAGEAFLKNASQRLKADKEVVLAAVALNGGALQYTSAALRTDKDVISQQGLENYFNEHGNYPDIITKNQEELVIENLIRMTKYISNLIFNKFI